MPTQNLETASIRPSVRHETVDADRDGQRLDNVLHAILKGVPRSHVYRLLRSGQVRVNGRRAKPGQRVQAGDDLRIPPLRQTTRDAEPAGAAQVEQMRQAIIHEDRDFLVVDKPGGVAAHGGSGISHGVIELLRQARPHDNLQLVHRLDRDTSGVMVLARRREALVGLQDLIRLRQVTKQYLALLEGHPGRARFDVNVPLRKFVLAGGERLVRVEEGGKPALTFFKCIESLPGASLHEVLLGTGRTHQIRVHAAHVGHALAGDAKYASHESVRHFAKLGLKRLFLHAARFEFDWQGRAYCFSAPLPDDLKQVLDALH